MVLAPHFEWAQDDSSLQIMLPLKGSKIRDVDILVADLVIKVNFFPYVLILDLLHEVEFSTSKATSKDGMLTLHVKKTKPDTWRTLQVEGLDKKSLTRRRNDSIERRRLYEQEVI